MSSEAYDNVVTSASAYDRALEAGDGIVRLAPAWVPRAFCTPGKRIRLHPDDYFPLGQGRGGIDERWLASAIRADNGPLTGAHEGLSLVVDPDGGLLPFDEFVAHHRADVIGSRLWDAFGAWTMYSKFYDNLGTQPISFLGLQPGATREQFIERLRRFADGGDNRITDLSLGYRTQLGTGWDIPAGVLHAPASICTYEPQAANDLFAMCESWSNNQEVPEALLWKDVPEDHHGDYEFVTDLLDWDKNVDVDFVPNRFMRPYATATSEADGGSAYVENWIVFRSNSFSAKELTVRPGQTVTVTDQDAYGALLVQGSGTFGVHDAQAATLIRYGQLSQDEFFVSEAAARAGVTISNRSATDDIVILKHFGPGNRELGPVG
jgi:hypothetical protein